MYSEWLKGFYRELTLMEIHLSLDFFLLSVGQRHFLQEVPGLYHSVTLGVSFPLSNLRGRCYRSGI